MARGNAAHATGRTVGRRLVVLAAVVAVAGGGIAGAVALTAHGEASRPKPAGVPSAQTAVVERRDLSDTRSLSGTLGFGGEKTVKGIGKGLVTRLPKTGQTVARGKPLYWLDDQPVMAFFGDTPMFRVLDKPDVSGRDVSVLAD
ncbi:hypothetical protein ACFVTW_15500, partial [Streptomyces liangshanensis]